MTPPDDETEWVDVLNDLVPAMKSSRVVVCLVPRTETDAKFAVELGVAIMLDKPIIAIVYPGTQVPAKLIQVADCLLEVNEGELQTAAFHERMRQTLSELNPHERFAVGEA